MEQSALAVHQLPLPLLVGVGAVAHWKHGTPTERLLRLGVMQRELIDCVVIELNLAAELCSCELGKDAQALHLALGIFFGIKHKDRLDARSEQRIGSEILRVAAIAQVQEGIFLWRPEQVLSAKFAAMHTTYTFIDAAATYLVGRNETRKECTPVRQEQ